MSPSVLMFAATGRSRCVPEPVVVSESVVAQTIEVAARVFAATGRSRSCSSVAYWCRGGAHSPLDREISLKSAVGVSLRRRPAFGPREPRDTRGTQGT